MDVNSVINRALSPLPCPASQRPAKPQETYVSWFEVLAQPALSASNAPRRTEHMVQVDVYSKQPPAELVRLVVELLRGAQVRVSSYGPLDFESDTGYHHMPITCWWNSTD